MCWCTVDALASLLRALSLVLSVCLLAATVKKAGDTLFGTLTATMWLQKNKAKQKKPQKTAVSDFFLICLTLVTSWKASQAEVKRKLHIPPPPSLPSDSH